MIQSENETGLALQSSTKASIVNDLVWYRIQNLLASDQSVKIRLISNGKNHGFLALYIHDKLLVRFKKLDEEGRARNYPTKFQQDYDSQMSMAEVPEATRVVFGYVLNKFHTGFAEFRITCPLHDDLLWQEVFLEENAEQIAIEYLPTPEIEEPVVKVKKPAQPSQASEQ